MVALRHGCDGKNEDGSSQPGEIEEQHLYWAISTTNITLLSETSGAFTREGASSVSWWRTILPDLREVAPRNPAPRAFSLNKASHSLVLVARVSGRTDGHVEATPCRDRRARNYRGRARAAHPEGPSSTGLIRPPSSPPAFSNARMRSTKPPSAVNSPSSNARSPSAQIAATPCDASRPVLEQGDAPPGPTGRGIVGLVSRRCDGWGGTRSG